MAWSAAATPLTTWSVPSEPTTAWQAAPTHVTPWAAPSQPATTWAHGAAGAGRWLADITDEHGAALTTQTRAHLQG